MVVTFALSQTDTVRGAGALNSAGNSSRVYDTWNSKKSQTVLSPIWDLNIANNGSKISSLQSVVWASLSVQVRYLLSYFNNSSFQSYPKIYFSFTRSLFVSKIACISVPVVIACISVPVSSVWRKSVDNDVLKSSQTRGGFSSEEEKEIFWLFRRVENNKDSLGRF